MENASKALIIAGAILLSILLISLGIMIFTQAQEVVEGSGMTQAQISSFNSKFTKYEGSNIPGTQVKSLIDEVVVNNADEDMQAAEATITLSVAGESYDPEDVTSIETSDIANNARYEVTMKRGGAGGRINEITISTPEE